MLILPTMVHGSDRKIIIGNKMKNKNSKKPILQQDLIKYCKQIGVTTIPTLVFEPKEYDRLTRTGNERRTKRNKHLGYCSYIKPVILVNLEYAGTVHRRQWLYRGKKYRWIPTKWNLRQARHTLVHELVHYQWRSMWHGYKFDKRISEILKGREFPPKQTKTEIQKEK